MKKRDILRAVVVAVSGLAMSTAALPAAAEYPRTKYLEADDYPGVHGNATVTFESEKRIYPVRMYVEDRACDSSDVYVRFVVYATGGPWATQKRRDSNGCGTSVEWSNLYIHDGGGIYAVQLEACVDSAGSDECDTSVVAYNPYLPYPDEELRLLIETVAVSGTAALPGPDGVVRIFGTA